MTKGEKPTTGAGGGSNSVPDRSVEFGPGWAVGLTRRQWEIAGLVGQGLDNASIGEAIGLHEKTVRNQLSVIYDVAGIADRTRLALRVQEWRMRSSGSEPAEAVAPAPADPGQLSLARRRGSRSP